MYVLVNTFFEYESGERDRAVGAVYGPFDTKQAAQDERDAMGFPHPEQVFVRPVYASEG